MRTVLKIVFFGILAGMIYVTTVATMQRGVFTASADLWPDLWFRATLADAYFGFITFYCWVAYKERAWALKILWFVLIMLFGNIAMSIYCLIQLFRLKAEESLKDLLIQRN